MRRVIKKRRSHPHCRRALKYANDVVSGKIPNCRLVIAACQRFINDLSRKPFPFTYNKDRAERFCNFVELFKHVKGKWAGTPFKLEPFQSFIYCNLFGWEDKDGLRRFRRAYVKIPRKNGKTFCAIPIGLGMLTIESEPGSEIYCGATSEDQADEVFRPAKAMVERAPEFKEAFNVSVSASSIYREDGLSFFKRLIGKPGEGQSPYCAIHDEYHEHKTSDQVDSMDTGMGARQEPLQFIITTAGKDTSSPCKELEDYAAKVLEGHFENERLFAVMYGVDPEDKWEDFEVWKKANPNFGVSVSEEYLRGKLSEAIQRTSMQNTVKTKHLNMWVNAGVGWVNMSKWNENGDASLTIEQFKDCSCWIGIDLASKIDLTAMMVLIYDDGAWYLFGKYYLPRDTIELPGNEHYQRWEDEGWLVGTPGARTDYAFLEEDLLEIYGTLKVEELVYDPREAEYLMQTIREKVSCPVVEMTQSAAVLSEPMKEFEAQIESGNLKHNGDPVLAWAAGNVMLKEARNKLYYPAKANVASKIDPIVAAIMAMARAKATVDDLETSQAFVEL